MEEQVRQFVRQALTERMNIEPATLEGDPPLGPGGIDLESLSVAELAVLLEEEYGVVFADEELEEIAGLTLDGFCAKVAEHAEGGGQVASP